METKLTPGCFQSTVFYKVGSPECSICAHSTECASAVRSREQKTLLMVNRFDERFSEHRTAGVEKWFSDRWKEKRVSKDNTERFKAILESWYERDWNPYHLKHGTIPIKESDDPILFHALSFMLESKAFKVRDIEEHLRNRFSQINKSKATAYSKLLCDTLQYADILTKDKKGVFCL